MTTNKKILSLVLALVIIFSFSATTFAADPGDPARMTPPNGGWYIHGEGGGPVVPYDPKTNPDGATYVVDLPETAMRSVGVTLVIEAGNELWEEEGAFRVEIPYVQVQTIGGYATIRELLYTVDSDPDYASYGLTFYGKSGSSLVPFTSTTNYLAAVEYDGVIWEAGQLAYDGWVFRVNDMFPLESLPGYGDPYYQGLTIEKPYIQDGDVVHFFYDFPAQFDPLSPDFAATNVRAVCADWDSSSMTVQLQGHKTFIEEHPAPDYAWMYVYDYEDLGGGITAKLYDDTGENCLTTATSNSSGVVTFTYAIAPDTKYVVKTVSTYQLGYSIISDGTYFDLTGAYSIIWTP